jgi:hypothetical protein
LAKDTVVQYYNLYISAKLEETKAQMLRDFYTQTLDLITASQSQSPALPMGQQGAPNQPLAAPQSAPQSPLLPNAPGASA